MAFNMNELSKIAETASKLYDVISAGRNIEASIGQVSGWTKTDLDKQDQQKKENDHG